MNPDQYDFILSPQQAKRGLRIPGLGGGSFGSRIAVVAGGGVALIVIIFIIGSLLGGGKASITTELTGLAQTQQEVARVAGQGINTATQESNQIMAVNTALTITTQQNALINFLAKYGVKIPSKTLGLKKKTATDAQLTAAQQSSTYDVVFAQIMQNELDGYMAELRQVFAATTAAKTRALLRTDYAQAAVLLKQVPSSGGLTQS